jgi:threonylcarbamoyladenosine tRNA methylthiotransferase CDKAL1
MVLKVYITTNGCVEGQLSSTFAEQFFLKNKSIIVNEPAEADVVVFYACGLTEPKEKDSLIIIKKLKTQMKPAARLIVWGCLPKINSQSLKTVYDGPIVGPNDVIFFDEFLKDPLVPFDDIEGIRAANMLVPSHCSGVFTYSHIGARARWLTNYSFLDAATDSLLFLKKDWDRLQKRVHISNPMFIRLASGCTGHCTYCSERCAFGDVKSRSVKNILSEFEWSLQQGYNLFSLIATDVGAYGLDMHYTLPELLTEMIKVGGKRNYKIILNQVNAFYLKKFFSDLEPVFESGKIDHLCCPIQSGSNRILKLMGRMHSVEDWKKCMIQLKLQFPHIQLGTQIMVGFPTETEEDFKSTLKLLDYPLQIDAINIFKYSGRPEVPAARLSGQISEELKELRYKRLLRKHARMQIFNIGRKCLKGRP